MKRLGLTLVIFAPLAFACGGGDGDSGPDAGEELPNPGFVTPEDITRAYTGGDGAWTEIGPADWSCLTSASTDLPTSVDVTLSGELTDFQNGTELPMANLTAYGDTDFNGAGLVSTMSDEDGLYSLTLPAGQTRVAFKVTLDRALDTYSLNQYFDPDEAAQSADINSVSILTANALPAFVGVTRTIGLGILAGTLRDCAGNEVGGAIATVSTTPAAPNHLDGANTFYFSAGSTSLPVAHNVALQTQEDGIFVTIELPVSSTAYLQVWGYIDGQTPGTDELTLLGELPSPVLADSVITADVDPLRSN